MRLSTAHLHHLKRTRQNDITPQRSLVDMGFKTSYLHFISDLT